MDGLNKHLVKEINKKRFDELNITQWQEAGITGKGVKIAVIGEGEKSHHSGSWLLGTVTTGAEIITLDTTGKDSMTWGDALEYCLNNDVDIVCVSYTVYGFSKKAIEISQKLHDKNVILLDSSGNEGVRMKYHPITLPTWYATGAYGLDGRMGYSNYGERLICLGYSNYMNKNRYGDYVPISHTSGTPQVICGMIAMLKQINPNLTIKQFEKFVEDNAIRISSEAWNEEEGWGLMKLPDISSINLEDYVYNKGEGDVKMEFKDVEKSKWSYQNIKKVTDMGIMKGYPDGTFNPTGQVTREELATVIVNLLSKIK